jgi:hypothetical protein
MFLYSLFHFSLIKYLIHFNSYKNLLQGSCGLSNEDAMMKSKGPWPALSWLPWIQHANKILSLIYFAQ